MKRIPRLIVLNLIVFLLSCSAEKGDAKNNLEFCYSNSNIQSIFHNGKSRDYILYIPDSYDGASTIPLVLNFHGFGESASEFMNKTDMRTVSESNTFILVYPQGSCLNGSSHWNACPTGGDNKSNADDFGFVESIISEISSQYNLDLERVYAAGYLSLIHI